MENSHSLNGKQSVSECGDPGTIPEQPQILWNLDNVTQEIIFFQHLVYHCEFQLKLLLSESVIHIDVCDRPVLPALSHKFQPFFFGLASEALCERI
jgi:hypothetical protein